MKVFPPLYAILDRGTLDARRLPVHALAEELRDAGIRLLQYRDKQGSPQQVLAGAAEISAVFAGTDTLLVMNDRADLAALAGWRGVHVGHRDMPPGAVRRVLGGVRPHSPGEKVRDQRGIRLEGTPHGLKGLAPADLAGTEEAVPFTSIFVGVSTHNEAQVRAAEAGDADYVAIGPVFATTSKSDTEPVVGLEGVRQARALTRKPLVAIGGMTRSNARSVIEAGADSVAVIGGLFVPGESVADVARDFLRILG